MRNYNFNDILNICYNSLGRYKREHVLIILLNLDGSVMYHRIFASGKKHSCEVNISKLIKELVDNNCYRFVISHNHNFGKLKPSFHDDILTSILTERISKYSIKLVDHIIVMNGNYYSYSENNFEYKHLDGIENELREREVKIAECNERLSKR